jgi:hypothetical protein
MKLGKLFKKAIEVGIKHDPRGKETVTKQLEATAKKYESMKGFHKEFFDTQMLTNPYSDSRVLNGDPETDIQAIMVGIDMDPGELVLADHLRKSGKPLDLVWAHHPSGRALAALHDVMKMQADIHAELGIPISAAEALIDERFKEIERRLMPGNHTRATDAAKLLNIPFMCTHTPSDNMVAVFLQKMLDEKKPYLLSDVIELLMEIPEYRNHAAMSGQLPAIFVGAKDRKAGRIFVDMTGGTSGNKKVYARLATSGVNTIVGMHMGDDHRKEAREHHVNVVIAGHIASDVLGMNLLIDALQKANRKKFIVHEASGFKRVQR